MSRYITFLFIIFLICSCSSRKSSSFDFSSRENNWPPISAYDDMAAWELSTEIAMMKKDLEYFERINDLKNRRLAIRARNRLNVLFQLYAEKTGSSLESVLKMHGY